MPNYQLPEGYKQTEVGVIPGDWNEHNLGDVLEAIDGDRGNNYPSDSDFSTDGYCLFLSARNVTKNGFRFSECFFITEKKDRLLRKGKLSRGDIVLTTRGTVGNFALFDALVPYDNIRINSGMVILRSKTDELDNRYLYAALNSHIVSNQIERTVFGSAQPQLTVKGISAFQIPLPSSREEQRVFATALSDVDALIAALDKLIAKKRHLKTATMQQLLTGKKRLPGFGEGKGYKQTEVGVIPEDWEVTTLKSVSNAPMQNGVFYKPSHKGSGVKLINVGDLYEQTPINPESLELFDASDDEKGRFRVEDGDLFFTRSSVVPSGIAHCNVYFSTQDECVVFDSHVIRVRPDKKQIDPAYLFRFCISPIARKYLVSHAKTGTMTTIDQGVLGECPVFLPELSEQRAIATVLSDMDGAIVALEARRDKIQAIKQGMMQQLLTGKTRLIDN